MSQVYADLIKEELDEADATTTDFRTRSLTIVTTSGGLVTLLSGLVAVASGGSKTWVFPRDAHGPLIWALLLYVLAAALALGVHFPRDVKRATPDGLKALLDSTDNDDKARREVAELHLKTMTSVRSLNATRAWLLLAAIALEIAAIAATGLTAATIIGTL